MAALNRLLAFLLRFTLVGLALAFIVVMVRPELLRQPRTGAEPTTAPAPAPTLAPAPAKGVASYADAVVRAAPAVVNIYTARVITERTRPSQLEDLLGGFWPRDRQRVENSLGSGVIVDSLGHLVTNNHVVENAAAIKVQLADGRVSDARIVGTDPDTDLAVLEIKLDKLPTMPLGRSDTLRVGDVVLAIGCPVTLSQTVTQGIVSATGRGQLGVATFEDFIQTDAAINVGNSGGALVNTDGELVGINTAVFSRNAGIEGIGFAIPVNLVRGVMDEILRNGRVARGWLGVVPENLRPEQAAALGVAPDSGVLVANLYRDSPAHRAGLLPGDVITHLDGERMTTAQQALALVASAAPGKMIRIRGLRRAAPFELGVRVEERPRR